MTWADLSNIATAVGFPFVCLAAVLAYLQLREMAAARWTEATTKVFEMLIYDEKTREARRFVRTSELPRPGHASKETFDKMYRVWVSFDNLGAMIVHNMLPEHLPMEMFYGSVIECWLKLAPHIKEERRHRGAGYQIFFEDLYCRSVAYRDKHYRGGLFNGPIVLQKSDA